MTPAGTAFHLSNQRGDLVPIAVLRGPADADLPSACPRAREPTSPPTTFRSTSGACGTERDGSPVRHFTRASLCVPLPTWAQATVYAASLKSLSSVVPPMSFQ